MHKIDGDGNVAGQFAAENLTTGQQPTVVTADWLNAVQDELVNTLAGAGISPLKADNTQLLQAVRALIESRVGDYVVSSNVGNAYTVALDPVVMAYTAKTAFAFKASAASTGAATLNAGGGVKPLVREDGSAMQAGDIAAGAVVSVVYDVTTASFRVTEMVASQVNAQITAAVNAHNAVVDPHPQYTTDAESLALIVANALPAGAIIESSSPNIPAGRFMRANGAAVSRTVYAALYAEIGVTYGAGDGSTTFNLPDRRDRMSVGAGVRYSLGAVGGSKDAIVVSHAHSITDPGHNHGVYDPGHSHNSQYDSRTPSGIDYAGSGSEIGGMGGGYTYPTTVSGTGIGIYGNATGIGVNASGSAGTDANMPPYLAMYHYIKY